MRTPPSPVIPLALVARRTPTGEPTAETSETVAARCAACMVPNPAVRCCGGVAPCDVARTGGASRCTLSIPDSDSVSASVGAGGVGIIEITRVPVGRGVSVPVAAPVFRAGSASLPGTGALEVCAVLEVCDMPAGEGGGTSVRAAEPWRAM